MSRTAFLLALCALSSSALARPTSVYFNNVRVDGLRNQSFTGVDVKFDENGDLYITAKGYKVTSVEPEKPTGPPTASGAHHFFIATMQPRVGAAQWDVDIFINKTFVHRFRSKDPEPVLEITRFLKPGSNVIHYQAKKEDGDRISTSPTDYFELVVGEGEMRTGQVMLNRLTAYRRTAAETGAFDSEVTIEVAALPQ
jgi:hypothetical protein